VVRGREMSAVVDALEVVTHANSALNDYAQERRRILASV